MIGFDKSRYQVPGAGPWGEFEYDQAGRGRDPAPGNPITGGLLDKRCAGHIAEARRRGVPVSVYWRVFPDVALEWQADAMCQVAGNVGIGKTTTLWLDIENPSRFEAWPGDAAAYEAGYVARVNANGWPCGTYANESFWRTRGIRGGQGRIVAKYNSNNGTINGTPPLVPWDIWQYTSMFGTGNQDGNTAEAAAISRLFGRSGTIEPPRARVFELVESLEN